MPTFRYAKLVRDNIWRWHVEAGHAVNGRQLAGEQLRRALSAKLHEEADEIERAKTRAELIEEIADARQVLEDMCLIGGISNEEVARVQSEKLSKKGGFGSGLYIETIAIPEETDEWAQYCRAQPEKYPEVDEYGHVSPALPSIEPGAYRHTKHDQQYDVVGVALHTETNEPVVVYRPLYKNKYDYFVRPYNNFTETVEIDGILTPRFEKLPN